MEDLKNSKVSQSEMMRLGILSAIVESSDDAIISKNLDGVITSWNNSAQRMFEYTAEEAIGRHISLLIPPELLPEEEMIISNIRSGRRVEHFKTIRVTKSGRRIHISITVSPVKDSTGRVIGASKIARDISEDVNKEQLILQYTRRLEILNSISNNISGVLDEHTILQTITDATTEITTAAFGAFFYNTVNPEGEAFMLYTLSGAPREAFEKFGMPRNTPVFHQTFAGVSVVRSDDITKDPRYGQNHPHNGMPAGHLPVVSYLAVPVKSTTGAVIGGLLFGHPSPGVFTEEHEEMVKSIALQASVALDNCRLFNEMKTISDKKDEFIALASHELKTPLTTVSGYLQVLKEQAQDDVMQSFLERSLRQVNKLNALVSDMFDASKVEKGKLILTPEYFNLRDLLLEIIEVYKYRCKTHTIHLSVEGENFWLTADRQRIEQVIENLLTNAVKYSPQADEVNVLLRSSSSDILVSVKDKGMGLSPAEQINVFKRFYRSNRHHTISGLGLGLYISSEIIKRHQGKLCVTSQPGAGSEFYFTLPVNMIT